MDYRNSSGLMPKKLGMRGGWGTLSWCQPIDGSGGQLMRYSFYAEECVARGAPTDRAGHRGRREKEPAGDNMNRRTPLSSYDGPLKRTSYLGPGEDKATWPFAKGGGEVWSQKRTH